jgi:hypothetical protein
MTKMRTEIFIETSETYIVKRKRFFHRNWCEECGREVNMAPPSEAALMMCHDTKTIYSLIDKKHIHFSYLKTETPLVCLRSLSLFENSCEPK